MRQDQVGLKTGLKIISTGILFLLFTGSQNSIALSFEKISSLKLSQQISFYQIFSGEPNKLTPANGFIEYDLVMGSFTDYAEKKRFIKIPSGQKLIITDDGLPQFPEGTILVKTFYYFNDKRNPLLGLNLIETRIMILTGDHWIAGTYRWNEKGTEANLVSGGSSKVNWIDDDGRQRSIQYHVPSPKECSQCHTINKTFLPIGPKVRNLNVDVVRNGTKISQLEYLIRTNVIDNDNGRIATLSSNRYDLSLEHRAKVYLDINCGHCHQQGGYCSGSDLKLSLSSINPVVVEKKSTRIDKMMSSGKMPMIGTTVVDDAGLALIKQYLEILKQN